VSWVCLRDETENPDGRQTCEVCGNGRLFTQAEADRISFAPGFRYGDLGFRLLRAAE
jgi:hypothetical protein